MSEVKRFDMATGRPEAGAHYSQLYHAALAREAALREELAKRDSRIEELAQECSDLSGELALFKSSDMMGSIKSWLDSNAAKSCDAIQQRLTAAEYWSGVLERAIFRALDDSSEDAETGAIEITRADYEALAILIGEPTESGASE